MTLLERTNPKKSYRSSSVYISRTSALFEPVLSAFDCVEKGLPRTDFFLQPARYSYSESKLADSGAKMPEMLEARTYEPRGRSMASTTKGAREEGESSRPMTYMPALETVYHHALNHELDDDISPSLEEEAFNEDGDDLAAIRTLRMSQDKALAVMGLTTRKGQSPRLFTHEALSPRSNASSSTTSEKDFDSHDLTTQYHGLLPNQAKESQELESEDDIKAEMRLIPQPLFSSPKHRRSLDTNSGISISPAYCTARRHNRKLGL